MMVSRNKKLDIEIRDLMLEGMKIALRTGHVDSAKEMGGYAAILKERIQTHDYSRADAFCAKEQEVKNYLKFGGTKPTPWK